VRLAEHARDALPPDAAAACDKHLAQCRRCLERYFQLGKRSLSPDIPNCFVGKEIGRGASGVVYKAWWVKDEPRLVALKVITCAGDAEKDRFDREIAVLRRIDSPGVVKCLDSGANGDARYYVMDFVQGVHLDKYLDSCTCGWNEKLAVFQRVCRAVADAHAKGVVHRDLKPRNILIDEQGRPHILDFGICTVETADWTSWSGRTITQPGAVIGTLKYMSPEQAWGGVAGATDERSDLWALGIMLYEIVTDGQYPYSLKSTPDKPAPEALLERVRKELPRFPRLDHLPRGRDMEVLLQRCLVWDPDRRIESAGKLADDLQRYVEGRSIHTRPLGIPYRLKRLAVGAATRSRWPFAVGFVAMLGLMLNTAAFLFDVGWHAAGHQFQGRADPSASAPDLGQARDGIVVAGVFDDTADAVLRFAGNQGIAGVGTDMKSWRAVHGHLMERLAPAGPRAVVWDYFFRSPQAGDARLVAGIRRLEEAGVPVILAAATHGDNGEPDLSPGIVEPLAGQLRHGAIIARDMVQKPGSFVMALRRREGVVVPSLALATFAAVRHPDARLDLDWPEGSAWINLLYEIQPRAYMRDRDRIKFTTVFEAVWGQLGVRAGDVEACGTFPLEKPERWAARTVPYHKLLDCPDEELRDLVSDKLIVVGDHRSPRIGFLGDRKRVRYGASIVNDVPGCCLLADAIAGLLGGCYMASAFPLPPGTLLGVLLLATTGCLLPVRLAATTMLERSGPRRLLWTALLGLSISCFLMMILSESYAVVHLGMAGISLLAPMGGSFWVEFARNRHRVADKKRRVIETADLGANQTVTLASRRLKRRPEAG